MNERPPPAGAQERLVAVERRLADQERALDELRADLAELLGRIHAIVDLLTASRGT